MHLASGVAAGLLFAQAAIEIYQRATALLERRDMDGARSAVEEALRVDPKLVPALVLKARLAIHANQLDEAQRAVETALALKPGDKASRFLLGFVFYLNNDFDRARTALAQADPNDARVVFYQAMTEEALNHTDAAMRLYERALKLDPTAAEPRVSYARLWFTLGKLDRAETLVDEALKLAGQSPDALYEKGRCLFERGEFAAAAEFGERALLAPGSAALERRIRYLLIRAYQKTGNRPMVERHQAAFDLLPNPLVR